MFKVFFQLYELFFLFYSFFGFLILNHGVAVWGVLSGCACR